MIEQAYTLGETLGIAVWCEDEAGPYGTAPYAGTCPAVEKLDTFWAGHKRGIGWPRAAASNSAGVR
jgi:hypothetical protein